MFFLTGFPGFLGFEMILRLLKRDPETQFLCLVQSKFLELAKAKRVELEKHLPGALKRVQLIEGDITLPLLGIDPTSLTQPITEVFHFAAVYDLNVKEELAKKINVLGTQNVLAFCKALPGLGRLHYVSTCYVSGRFDGVFKESDLELGQKFNNFYESTKYEAEVLVRQEMKLGLPVTIYRPSVVVGNSKTGETQKFDGPYVVIQWLLRQGKIALLPRMGDPNRYHINLVPSDYVIDAMTYLCTKKETIHKTFHLADPAPFTIAKVVSTLAHDCGKTLLEITLPKSFTKFAVSKIPGLEAWLKIPKGSLDYFVHPTQYDTQETLDALKGSGIACPEFSSYSKILVEFMKQNPGLRSKALT